MANHQYSANQLTEGNTLMVKGKVFTSTISRVISDPAEFARINQATGGYPVTTPHTRLTLTEPQIVRPQGAQPTIEEAYVEERFYTNSEDNSLRWSIVSKGLRLPNVAKLVGAAGNQQAIGMILEGEPARGVEALVQLRIYRAGENANRGMSIDYIILQAEDNGEIRYYSNGPDTTKLSALGITFDGNFPTNNTPVAPQTQQPAPQAPVNNGPVVGDGLNIPAEMPATNPFTAAPQQAPAQPVQQAPAQAPAPAQPAQQGTGWDALMQTQQAPVQNDNTPFGANQPVVNPPAQPAPQQQAQQPAPQASGWTTGISFPTNN